MSSDVQRPDDSPSTSGGSSDIEQRESVPAEQEREQAQPKKKETKISSKTAAKLSTSAKRYGRAQPVRSGGAPGLAGPPAAVAKRVARPSERCQRSRKPETAAWRRSS